MNSIRYFTAAILTMLTSCTAAAEISRIIDPRHNEWGWPMVKLMGKHIVYVEPGDPFNDPPLPTTIYALDSKDLSEVAVLEMPAGRPYDIKTLSEDSIAIGLVHANTPGSAVNAEIVIQRPGSAQWSQDVTVEKAGIVAIIRLIDEKLELQNQIRSPQPSSYASFGHSVSAEDGLLAVGEDGAAHLFEVDSVTGTARHLDSVAHPPGEPVSVLVSGELFLSAGLVESCCGGEIVVHTISNETLTPLAQIEAPTHAEATNYGATLQAVEGGFLVGGPGVNKGDDGGLLPGTLDYLTDLNVPPANRFTLAADLPRHAYGARHRICSSGVHVGALIGGHLVIARLDDGIWSEVARQSLGDHGAIGFDCGDDRFVTVAHDRSNGARRWRVWTIAFNEIW